MATQEATRLHGGRLVSAALKAHGVSHLFTLSGGHLFSIYDGCRHDGIAIVDTRHEQTAAFAAEGWAKATRSPGVCALTAGPRVTKGGSALARSVQNGPPPLPPGGRAPAGPRRHDRDERPRRVVPERLARARAGRPRAGDALGPGVAPGDRPRPVRRAGDEVGGHGEEPGRDTDAGQPRPARDAGAADRSRVH